MKIGNFEILEILENKAYKAVYLARDTGAGDPFFVHEHLDAKMADHEQLISRCLSGCPVDQFVDAVKHEGKTLLVQPPYKGVTPDVYFNEASLLADKLFFVRSLLAILKDIHDKGVIFNNLSFANITIDQNKKIMLHDLVAAALSGKEKSPGFSHIFQPHFVAPERTDKVAGSASFSSDYYAFGVLLYWLLTGRLPFEDPDMAALISLHVAGRPKSPVCVNPDIPENLSRITEKLLEKEPAQRYKSIDGILYDLKHYDDPGFEPASMDRDLKFKVSGKIYGRQPETGRLQKAVEQIREEKIRLVTIAGHAGVGKSTIVQAFQKSLAPGQCRFIAGKFQQYKKDIPYFAIVEAFDEFFDMLLLSDQKTLDDFQQSFENTIADQGMILTLVFPRLEMIVGRQETIETYVGEEAEHRFAYVFLKLIRMVATRERPLVLFLDDMQWADLVSLNLLRAVFQNSKGFLLVVLCYRATEVDPHHPFHRLLDDVHRYEIPFEEIRVDDLQPGDVSELIADSMGCENQALSHMVFEKTHGNPFFVHQLLAGMADQGYFEWDAAGKNWSVDLDRVAALKVSKNVVALMQTRLRRLPGNVIDLMKVIGAVGHNADLDVLSIVTGKPINEILQLLKIPFEHGLVSLKQPRVYFTHDKIQQACYQLNPAGDLPGLHFAIAVTLMAHKRMDTPEDMFNLAGHLDKGFELIVGNLEPYIGIYMAAALKSKEISAYKAFLHYVDQAMGLLNDALPEPIRFRVYRQYHIALYLNSLFDEADTFFYDKLAGYKDPLLLRENYFSKVSQDSMRKNYRQAVEFGMSIIKTVGVQLSMDPGIADLGRELEKTERLLAQAGIKNIHELSDIEQKNSDEMQVICEVIMAMLPASFFYNPHVLADTTKHETLANFEKRS